MLTVPDHILQAVPRGGRFVYLVEIAPAAPDSWSAYRWADVGCIVDGDTYLGGYLKDIPNVAIKARLERMGGIAERGNITLKIVNRDDLANEFIDNHIEGRDVSIWLTTLPTNLCKNSTLDERTGNDFDNWDEDKGDASNTITANTSVYEFDGVSAAIYWNTGVRPNLICDPITVRRGENLAVSAYVRALIASNQIDVAVRLAGTPLYWDGSQFSLGVSYPWTWSPSNSAFTRYEETVPADEIVVMFTAEEAEVDFEILFSPSATSEGVYVDGVQVEPRTLATPFQRYRNNLTATELFQVYLGEVRDLIFDKKEIRIRTKSILNRRHREIPATILTEDTDSGWTVPPDNIGKPFPMTYGTYYMPSGIRSGRADPSFRAAIALLVNSNDIHQDEPIKAYFDKPGRALNLIKSVGHYSEDHKRVFPELWDDRASPVYVAYEWDKTAAQAMIAANSAAGYLPAGQFPINVYMAGQIRRADSGTWNGFPASPGLDYPTQMIDNDVTTYARAQTFCWAEFQLEKFGVHSMNLIDVFAMLDAYCNTYTATPTVRFEIVRYNAPAFNIGQVVWTPPSAATWFKNAAWSGLTPTNLETAVSYLALLNNEMKNFDFWGGMSDDVFFRVEVSATNSDIHMYTVGLRIDATIDLLAASIVGEVEGREFLTDWGRSKPVGAVINRAPETVESIYREELGVPAAEINGATFDAALAGRPYPCAGQVVEIERSEKVIERICKEYLMLSFPGGDGRENLVALGYQAIADVLLRERDFLKDSIKISWTPREAVINDFTFRFRYNHIIEEYTTALYCNKDGKSSAIAAASQTLCSDSYTELGNQINKGTFDFKWINFDSTTMPDMADRIIAWNSKRRMKIKGRIFLSNLGLELGDVVAVNVPQTLTNDGGQDLRFVVEGITIRKKQSYIDLELLEVQ